MNLKIFVINPGSTSTKIAVFNGKDCEFSRTVNHDPEELKTFRTAAEQFDLRFMLISDIADHEGINLSQMDAFAGRGGMLKPMDGGTYIIGKDMLEDLSQSRYGDHASNLGAMIAEKFAVKYGKRAFIADPPVVDELMDEARYTGLPEILRISKFHALNQKAGAIYAANGAGIEYNKSRLIVAHLGGGISIGAHDQGRVIEVNNALEEGPFSPERAGSLPTGQLVDLCFGGKYSKTEIQKMLVGKGGFCAYTGSTDFRKLEGLIDKDIEINKLINAFIYQISKEICACSAALYGKIDLIVITGGMAASKYLVDRIIKRVSFLGKIIVVPGEREMIALAEGAIRVLEGTEEAKQYVKG